MRIRITAANQKLVNQSRGKNLSANAEVNRVLAEHYSKPQNITITTEALQSLLGKTNARRFLRTE